MGNIFNTLFTIPITNVLVVFYQLLSAIHVPYALGFAIILLTIFIRLILYPLMSSQIKAAAKMQKVTPHINALKEKHKNDKVKQQQEMMRLYKEHGVNPAAGCLPTLLQLPVIFALYNVLNTTVGAVNIESINNINKVLYLPSLKINSVWDTGFFGVSLADNPSKIAASVPFIVLLPVITGVLQFALSKMMVSPQNPQQTKDKKENVQSDISQAMQTQSMYIFPAMIGFFSFTLPIGLSLYWNTFTIFGILQQYILVGAGGLKPWIDKIRNKLV